MSHQITHVIYDLDGTLVNTINLLIEVFREFAESYQKVLSLDIERGVANITSIPEFFNMVIDSVVDIHLRDTIDRPNQHKLFIKQLYSKPFQLIPGVEQLVQHLHKHGIPQAIATGNTLNHLAQVRAQLPAFLTDGVIFTHSVCGWDDPDVILKKPHPDVYHVCARRWPVQPKSVDNILIIEDSLTGVTGAVASGMKTLLINDRKSCNFDAIADKITKICDKFDDFKPESVGLPPY